MWVMTELGFYSAVQDRDPDVLQVRCRSKKDALALAAWLVETDNVILDDNYPTTESLVLEWKGRDYPYRLLLWREQWVAFMAATAGAIDYTNFKDNVKKEQGPRRASTYGRVWGVLLDIEKEHLPQPKVTRRHDDYEDDWFENLQRLCLDDEPALIRSYTDTDDRCPRCDKFLGDVGVNADGDCNPCGEDLDAATENEDWGLVEKISLELGYGEMTS